MDEAIRRVLASDARIAYAYRFGSTATGRSTPHSDVDVGIGLRDGASMDHRDLGALVSQLERATGHAVDLVIVSEAAPGLAYRVFRDGLLVCESDRRTRVLHQARAVLAYLDFKPVEERFAKSVLERAARG